MSYVFLAYSLRDEREAAQLCEDLRGRGVNVWWDAELPPGRNWAHEVGRALDKSDGMVVLVSPQSMASDLVKRELRHAIFHHNFRNRLFPVIIKPTSDVPWYFRMLPVFDLTKNRARGISSLVQALQTPANAAEASEELFLKPLALQQRVRRQASG